MKIEKITDNKIRIIINVEELSGDKSDIINLLKNHKKTHSLFEQILKEAEKQVGFNTTNCQLFFEVFSSSDGCIVFILTKYKNNINLNNSSKNLKYKRKSLDTSHKNVIYKFSSFEDFCNFCTYCTNHNFSNFKNFAKNISLYSYKDNFYLILTNINLEFEKLNLFYSLISEFSEIVSTSLIFKSKLLEHGKVIFKANALDNTIKYFV